MTRRTRRKKRRTRKRSRPNTKKVHPFIKGGSILPPPMNGDNFRSMLQMPPPPMNGDNFRSMPSRLNSNARGRAEDMPGGMNEKNRTLDSRANENLSNVMEKETVLNQDETTEWSKWNKPGENVQSYITKGIKNVDKYNKKLVITQGILNKLNRERVDLERAIETEREKINEILRGSRKPSAKGMDKLTIKLDQMIEKREKLLIKIRKFEKESNELEEQKKTTNRTIHTVEKKIKKKINTEKVVRMKNDSTLYNSLLAQARAYHKNKPKMAPVIEPVYDPNEGVSEEHVYVASTQRFASYKRTYDIGTGVVKIGFSEPSTNGSASQKVRIKKVENPYLFLEKALTHLDSRMPIHKWLSGYYHFIANPQGPLLGGEERSLFKSGFEFAKKRIEQGTDPLQIHTVEVRINLANDNLRTVDERCTRELLEIYTEAQYGDAPTENHRPWPVIPQTMTREIIRHTLSRQAMRNLYNIGIVPSGASPHDEAIILALKTKMEIEASTRSNAIKFISHYCATSPIAEPLLFTEGLIRAMRDVHRVMNEGFQKNFRFGGIEGHEGTTIVHSGGSLFGLISGVMLSFLLPPGEPSSFIERIKAAFIRSPQYDTFIDNFKELIGTNPLVLLSLIETAVKVSDIDVLVMTDYEHIETLDSEFLQAANLACAKLLRDILVSDVESESFLPFPPHEPYAGKTFSSFSGLSTEDFREISGRGSPEAKQRGSQTSNRIEAIKILLNRLKGITLGGIQLGEFLDICIGSMENPTFREKLLRFLMDDYYTLDMLIDELEAILAKGEDDKSQTRRKRLALLKELKKIPGINDLFRIIGRAISNEDIDEILQWEGTYDPELDDP